MLLCSMNPIIENRDKRLFAISRNIFFFSFISRTYAWKILFVKMHSSYMNDFNNMDSSLLSLQHIGQQHSSFMVFILIVHFEIIDLSITYWTNEELFYSSSFSFSSWAIKNILNTVPEQLIDAVIPFTWKQIWIVEMFCVQNALSNKFKSFEEKLWKIRMTNWVTQLKRRKKFISFWMNVYFSYPLTLQSFFLKRNIFYTITAWRWILLPYFKKKRKEKSSLIPFVSRQTHTHTVISFFYVPSAICNILPYKLQLCQYAKTK